MQWVFHEKNENDNILKEVYLARILKVNNQRLVLVSVYGVSNISWILQYFFMVPFKMSTHQKVYF